MVQIHLKKSKCDQFGIGSDIVVGVTGTVLYPVSAMVDYLDVRGTQPGPFFRDAAGRTVTKPWFVRMIREVLATIGIPAHQYAGHSFQIGAATTAALVGIEDSAIQTLGRWHSADFLQYIWTPKEHLASISASLAWQGTTQLQGDSPVGAVNRGTENYIGYVLVSLHPTCQHIVYCLAMRLRC